MAVVEKTSRKHRLAEIDDLPTVTVVLECGEEAVQIATFKNSLAEDIEIRLDMRSPEELVSRHAPEIELVFRLRFAVAACHLVKRFGEGEHRTVAGVVADDELVADVRPKKTKFLRLDPTDLIGTEVVAPVVAEDREADESVQFRDLVRKNWAVGDKDDAVNDLAKSAEVEKDRVLDASVARERREHRRPAVPRRHGRELPPQLDGAVGKRILDVVQQGSRPPFPHAVPCVMNRPRKAADFHIEIRGRVFGGHEIGVGKAQPLVWWRQEVLDGIEPLLRHLGILATVPLLVDKAGFLQVPSVSQVRDDPTPRLRRKGVSEGLADGGKPVTTG